MTGDHEKTVVIATTRTAFEADTIATALKAQGFDARVVDTATAAVWGGVGGGIAQAKVIVLEHEAAGARQALSQIRFEGQSIDWDAVDVGEAADGPRMSRWSRTRRAMWTLAVAVLPPLGVVVLIYGVQQGQPMVQVMGGTVLAAAVVMVLLLVMPARRNDGPVSEDLRR